MDSLKVNVTLVKNVSDAQFLYGGIGMNMLPIGSDSKAYLSYPQLILALKWYVECGNATPRRGNFTKVFTWHVWVPLLVLRLLAMLATFWIHKEFTRASQFI
jgi:hypothetical protein